MSSTGFIMQESGGHAEEMNFDRINVQLLNWPDCQSRSRGMWMAMMK